MAFRIALGEGREFDSEPGETLLDAAARAGVTLPYSCRSGRCSTCACRITSGDSSALHPETGLTERERANGWVLACVRSATSDLTVEANVLGGLDLAPARIVPCRIEAIAPLAPDVMKVVLRLPPNAVFNYRPGQYVDILAAGNVRRSYSLANAQGPRVELHIRQVEDGVLSAYWFGAAKQNDLLRLNGPLGTFVLREVAGMDLVFLATGTGIAPVKAMLEEIAQLALDARPASVAVFWGGRTQPDLYWDVNAVDAGQRYVPVLSRAGEDWQGARGHVQDVYLAEAPNLARAVVYACGNEAMVRAAETALSAAGLPPRRFRSDAFVASDA
ncbi:2Fe-2S iron-sulfur cluster-binding protein [Massilia sp. Mn16-1_5]|uniref:2Fe-2S iron-sulfur cluster-binding protein n=1 Tax=Massilia sp. Mn16-1_5 TaxID=2079199 RepID=UPI00109E58A0|nr:2Fe-2S iron-sulfur cluster-binding protein [Massilia sp. Mn16-1_5]THC43811.1 NAD(P)H-flavin reductase [Massilia sp. Mn16-1_5]